MSSIWLRKGRERLSGMRQLLGTNVTAYLAQFTQAYLRGLTAT
jgi:hypothetical protein